MNIFTKNCCDGIYRSYDVHFTKFCDNKCAFCVDRGSITVNSGKPDWRAMADAIINNQEGFDDVLILGGEPCLFLPELFNFVEAIKTKTALKVYATSAMPKTCYDDMYLFFAVLQMLDGFNISAQHHNEAIADKIRGTKSQYDRQAMYGNMPFKEKIRINLNFVARYLDTRESLTQCLQHYDNLGFSSIKLSEIQHNPASYVSFESVFDVKLPSPYFGGCQTYIDTEKLMGIQLTAPVLLKRSCFACEKSLKASFMDGVKVFYKIMRGRPLIDNSRFGVVYEDGTIQNGWIKEF